jgi:hypothetical protein
LPSISVHSKEVALSEMNVSSAAHSAAPYDRVRRCLDRPVLKQMNYTGESRRFT